MELDPKFILYNSFSLNLYHYLQSLNNEGGLDHGFREDNKHNKYSCKLMLIPHLFLFDLYDLMVNPIVRMFFIGNSWEPYSRLMSLWLKVIPMWVECYFHHLCQVSLVNSCYLLKISCELLCKLNLSMF